MYRRKTDTTVTVLKVWRKRTNINVEHCHLVNQSVYAVSQIPKKNMRKNEPIRLLKRTELFGEKLPKGSVKNFRTVRFGLTVHRKTKLPIVR